MTRRVIVVLYDGFLLLDIAGPLGAFEVASYGGEPGYSLALVSVDGGGVRASCGAQIHTETYGEDDRVDLMIVPGGPGTEQASSDPRILELIRRIGASASRSASVCSGAFLLAAAGLLQGRRATTHWALADRLEREHPNVVVHADRIFIEDRDVWTSAGVTAGIDLALTLIERDQGFSAAQRAARALVVHHRRSGGQRQFSAALELQCPDRRFAPLLEWAGEHLDEPLGVERLAAWCHLSPRQFSRAFTGVVGMPPGQAIAKLRVDRAVPDVVAGEFALEVIARRYGFGSSSRMCRTFIRLLGFSPQALRGRSTHSTGAGTRENQTHLRDRIKPRTNPA